MDKLEIRKKIDEIDEQIVKLFSERMEQAKQIAMVKKESGQPIFDPVREREKLADVISKSPDEMKYYTPLLFSQLFELSRSYQNKLIGEDTALTERIKEAIEKSPKMLPDFATVACMGEDGTDLTDVCDRLFNNANIMVFNNYDAVFTAVEKRLCQYALIPVENSVSGTLGPVYDLMMDHNFFIVKSIRVRTDSNGEYTRYICISKELEIYPGADVTSLMLTLPHKMGSLYKLLSRFYALGINLSKIESRPLPGKDMDFMFYLDIDVSVYSPSFIQLLDELPSACEDFTYLGSYVNTI
ncbi:MAG: chorismate mutase [Lachnospiraceae bacterium]|nr:chorismate mutase [Lachnospiraceae bacterium]